MDPLFHRIRDQEYTINYVGLHDVTIIDTQRVSMLFYKNNDVSIVGNPFLISIEFQ